MLLKLLRHHHLVRVWIEVVWLLDCCRLITGEKMFWVDDSERTYRINWKVIVHETILMNVISNSRHSHTHSSSSMGKVRKWTSKQDWKNELLRRLPPILWNSWNIISTKHTTTSSSSWSSSWHSSAIDESYWRNSSWIQISSYSNPHSIENSFSMMEGVH